ncbi:glycoside hydrolase superfamily [Absidia repens]|uniref:mannan endo-1,4-beta-mannosidase n=1 Tax=Absidia repens TaxID=90262 RepID=A0A1X2I8K6_9FUNG|nr:glycoside hydrolase superfamily [Absidia repens]
MDQIDNGFVRVSSGGFMRNGKPYYIRGANYWYGMNMGALLGGDRSRLETELDQLKTMGCNNLRIMAGSEGPNDQKQLFRMQPSLMTSPGNYNESVFQGLDYLLDAMGKRDMTAVVTLSNFWHWSGGFSQYVAWVTNTIPPYPTRDPETWGVFTQYTSQFYNNDTIRHLSNDLFKAHIRVVQGRQNVFNGKVYRNDPVIMSWQIANEAQAAPKFWYDDVAKFIKQGTKHQLVSSGIESKLDYTDFLNAHSSSFIDYCTCHLWVENWGIYKADDPASLKSALVYATDYINTRAGWAADVGKPMVLEEYATLVKQYKGFVGSNFWSYSGIGRSTDLPNNYSMVWIGDPPHEPRGWYSVYDQDTTVNVIQQHYMALKDLELKGLGT